MQVIYSGFDGLDISIRACIPESLNEQLKLHKAHCAEHDTESVIVIKNQFLKVFGHGARGGYAYVCEFGICGSKWFFKRPNKNDPWGIRLSASSAALAANGIEGFRQYIEESANFLGIEIQADAVSITRVDFAVDILAPGFTLDRDNLVTHARTNISDHDVADGVNTNGHSSRITSVTAGRMPSRQVIIYDKREEVMVKRKNVWPHIWAANMEQLGLPQVDFSDPKSSRIWRIEARAGKDHLQGKWGIRGWGSLYEKLPGLMEECFAKIRYCNNSSDPNRSRWPLHPIWALAGQTVQSQLLEFETLITTEEIVEIQKQDLIELLQGQLLGISTSMAAIEQVRLAGFDQHIYTLAHRLLMRSRYHQVPLEERLERSKVKYARFSGG
jgi:hypothetical protein